MCERYRCAPPNRVAPRPTSQGDVHAECVTRPDRAPRDCSGLLEPVRRLGWDHRRLREGARRPRCVGNGSRPARRPLPSAALGFPLLREDRRSLRRPDGDRRRSRAVRRITSPRAMRSSSWKTARRSSSRRRRRSNGHSPRLGATAQQPRVPTHKPRAQRGGSERRKLWFSDAGGCDVSEAVADHPNEAVLPKAELGTRRVDPAG
jgi:hypothetical protein